MAECNSAECQALLGATDKLTSELAADLITVTTKLVTKGLISLAGLSSAQLQTKEKELRASELVKDVISKVNNFPEKFEVFLDVLNEIPSLQDLATCVDEERKRIITERASVDGGSGQNQGSPPPPTKSEMFPYLKAEHLSDKQREALLARLERESGEMQDDFAILVDKVRESLEKQNITCSDLSVLVRYSQKNRLLGLFKKKLRIKELFSKLDKYWWFFDYEFLTVLIKRHCMELKPELDAYVTSFKQYCKRRVCEVPIDVFKKRGDAHNLYVKCDHNFDKYTLSDVKKMESKLSGLLETELYLLGVDEGCIKLTFDSLCAITPSFSSKQLLKKLSVTCLHDHNTVFFGEKKVPARNFTHQSDVAAKRAGSTTSDEPVSSTHEKEICRFETRCSPSMQRKYRKMILDVSEELTREDCEKILYLESITLPNVGISKCFQLSTLSSLEAYGYLSPSKVAHLENLLNDVRRQDLLHYITSYKESQESKESIKDVEEFYQTSSIISAKDKNLFTLVITHISELMQISETLHETFKEAEFEECADRIMEQFEKVATNAEEFKSTLHSEMLGNESKPFTTPPLSSSSSSSSFTDDIPEIVLLQNRPIPLPRKKKPVPRPRRKPVPRPRKKKPVPRPRTYPPKSSDHPKEFEDSGSAKGQEVPSNLEPAQPAYDSGIGYVSDWTDRKDVRVCPVDYQSSKQEDSTHMPLLPATQQDPSGTKEK